MDGSLSWELLSNNGHRTAAATLVTTRGTDRGPVYVADVELRAHHGWLEPPREDHLVRLGHVEIPRTQLRDTQDAVARWLDDRRAFERDLAPGDPGTRLSITLGPDPDFVSSVEKPVCRLRYATESGMEGTSAWVTDETCLRAWLDGLSSWLNVAIGA